MLQAQAKKIIRARGASVHGLPALRQMPGNKWLEVAMIRMNHNGTRMDGPVRRRNDNPGNVSEVVEHVKQVKKEGMGVISMKLIGDGDLHAAATTARPPCASPSRTPAWIASRSASRARRRSTKPSTT